MYVEPGALFNQFNGSLTAQRLLGYVFANASGTVPKKMKPFTYIYLKYEGGIKTYWHKYHRAWEK